MIVMPTIIEKSPNGHERWIDIPSKLYTQRIVMLVDEVSEDSSSVVIAQLLYLDSQSHEDINLIIKSPGGSIVDGLAIYDVIKNLKSKVNTVCYGMCASMGAFLLSSGTGKRKASVSSRIMLHSLSGGTRGKIEDMRIDHKESEYLQAYLNKILAKNCDKTIAKIKKDCNRDFWMSAEDAVEYGLIDEII